MLKTSTRAGAAAAAAAMDRRHFSCELHRCDNDDDDDDAAAVPTDNQSLWRTSSSSSTIVPRFRQHRDNSVVLVEVVCDCRGAKQQARTTARPLPRSASVSPSNRSRVAGRATGPASDSEITARSTKSHELSDSAGAVLQV